jgi:hypothetical protein
MTMSAKKTIVLATFGTLLIIQAFPQRFQGGVSAGLNVSQVEGDGFAGYNKAGLNAGIFVNTSITEQTGIQLEIRYSEKGSNKQGTLEQPEVYRIELKYIELPLLLLYRVSSRFKAEAGVANAYLFSYNEKDAAGEIPVETPFSKWELAGIVGGSYILTDHVSAWTRLSYSILRIRKHDSEGVYWLNRGQYNNVITFGFHYYF